MKKIISIIATMMTVIMLAGTAFAGEFSIEDFDAPVPVHTENQKAALGDLENFKTYCDGFTELGWPEPVVLTWEYDGDASDGFKVFVSTDEDMSGAKEYTTTDNSVELINLMIGTKYYYTVSAGDDTSDVHSFETEADGPRNMKVDSITNVRDIGGWPLEQGGRVRQGMVFRTGRLNGCSSGKEETRVILSDEGREVLVNELGIKTELDIRDEGENEDITESVIGNGVNYIFIPFDLTGSIEYSEVVVSIIKVFAEEENYPIAFHCSVGTDRTGFITFLINGLLGVSEQDLQKDYLFSDMGVIRGHRDLKRFKQHDMDRIADEPGDTISAKIKNYLLRIGVTKEELDEIVRIMTE
ncbi:MAG: tyrosine-protein phosphatase [Parasporobacterium sp.]|nr:tyrosine-protein phosphatase [Parasporobacterium sp.]